MHDADTTDAPEVDDSDAAALFDAGLDDADGGVEPPLCDEGFSFETPVPTVGNEQTVSYTNVAPLLDAQATVTNPVSELVPTSITGSATDLSVVFTPAVAGTHRLVLTGNGGNSVAACDFAVLP